jgi:capsular polysaccharide biosynthesis protein
MEEINLYDLLRFYAKKWLTIASFAIAGAIIGVIFTYYIQQPLYKSSATVLLVGTNRTSGQESVVLNNYVKLFNSRRVLTPVIAKHDYNKSFDSLVANTTAENTKNTDFISLSMSTTDAKTSKVMLESAIQEFGKQAKELYGDNSVRISIVDAANTPTGSTNVKPLQQIGIATVALTALSIIGLFFVYDYKHSQLVKAANAKPAAKKKPAKKTSNQEINYTNSSGEE